MKRIMIDIDDTICKGGFLKLVNDFLVEDLVIEEIDEYYVQSYIPEEKLGEFYDYFFSHNVYNYSAIIDDAIEVIEKLSHEYEIYICSSYLVKGQYEESAILVPQKHKWLLKNLPFIDPSNFIFTSSKHIIDCDIKIDDLLTNLEGTASTKLLFSSFHNDKYTDEELSKLGVRRVNSWKEIEKLLLNQENNR
ncbi:MAG: hypothetical protein PHD10_01575 [Bacilli bacterium]|nr:hypothetical protein [Bacilli bacterium]MDD4607812.1 hypothetical protein [Bacilli bacterium]